MRTAAVAPTTTHPSATDTATAIYRQEKIGPNKHSMLVRSQVANSSVVDESHV